jgi:hypothetical protein
MEALMLAEIFMLRLETAFRDRNVGVPLGSRGDRRFVPIKQPISRIYNPQPSSTKNPT